ncbi:MAG: hypothetical protein KAI66_15720 [Lentisphaeria bacterium]|nr:hypothetical protein [Lentisphaeria bacterium]
MSGNAITIEDVPRIGRRAKIVIAVVAGTVLVAVVVGGWWMRRRLAAVDAFSSVLTETARADPDRILKQVNRRYRGMSDEQRKAALDDPAVVEQLFAEMTVTEMRRSFAPIFKLPRPVRARIFKESAASIRESSRKHTNRDIAEFLDSPSGKGMLSGLSQFFILELSGREKAETAPLANEIFRQINRGKAHGRQRR